jgi:hypothetical protein
MLITSCHETPTAPQQSPLAIGRWTGVGVGACLAVATTGCNLTVGCGHGQFPRPALRQDGTFEVDGTYRVEVGPVSPNPAPPAHFSGALAGPRLILTVTPSDGVPSTYSMTMTTPGTCGVPCV